MELVIWILLLTVAPYHVLAFDFIPNKIITAKTPVGEIKGCEEELQFLGKTTKVNKFIGIPYAEPPIGDLRFQKPVPKAKFAIPIEALVPGHACLQPKFAQDTDGLITYSEDCLYLNVYAPSLEGSSDFGKKFAVMIYIHGSDFNSGSSDIYQPDHMVIEGEVIVVTFNYRLSIWGFLSTGDGAAPGNYGLWDQQLAIKWVYDNIESFGGDRQRITLFGNSAGSVSAIYQALYPGNNGHFSRIICQSGAPGAWFASNEETSQSANILSSIFSCNTGNKNEIAQCLRKVSADRFVNLITDYTTGLTDIPSIFLPRNDGEFISYDPKQVFEPDFISKLSMDQRKAISSINVMAGINSGDGGISLSPSFGVFDPEKFLPLREYFETRLVPQLVSLAYGEDADDIVRDVIIAEYTNWSDTDSIKSVREEYLAMHLDFAFTRPLYNTVDLHAALSTKNDTYMYIFDVELQHHTTTHASWLIKPSNQEEIPYIFGFKNSNRVSAVNTWLPSPWEIHISRDVIILWTNFAKTGDPNQPIDLGISWKPYTKRDQHYFHITHCLMPVSVKQHWNLRRANFWTKLLPAIKNASKCSK